MSINLKHLQILWGIAGAREKFEDLVVQLIHVERPDSQRIRIMKGDGGLDAFEGVLSKPEGIDVFQVKYFPEKIDDAQKKQIRDSFATVRDSTRFKVNSWTLCLPADMSLDETLWFEGWAKDAGGSGIDIRKPWGALHLEGLLLQERNSSIRETFFREENTELLRRQAGHLEKLLHELTQRVPVPTRAQLRMTLTKVTTRNAYAWVEDKMVVEVQLWYRLTNVGPKSIPKWTTDASLTLHDDELENRLVNKVEFPRIGSGDSYIRMDSTILPTTSRTTEQIFGVVVRRSEKFDEMLPAILNAISITFWPITEDGPGEETTLNLADVLDWTKLLPSFQQAYMLGLGRLSAE
ncbi:MAG: hypothetical protein M3552_15610 [Planctomycetota bacterium]|nr:hypothetical protein [Planctomycetota bacterium]